MIERILFWLRRFLGLDSIGYIYGPETLPSPLGEEEEAAALAALPDDGARALLIERNLRLVVFVAKRFEGSCAGVEDLISIGTIGLIKAIATFRTDKNIKLATYASRCIENEILMYLRKTQHQKGECSLDEPLNVDWDGNELLLSDVLGTDGNEVLENIENEEERVAVRRAIASLPARERMLVEMRYGIGAQKELTQKEVADKMGISQSYISRLEKKILDKLKLTLGG